jgi:hypothetical protein
VHDLIEPSLAPLLRELEAEGSHWNNNKVLSLAWKQSISDALRLPFLYDLPIDWSRLVPRKLAGLDTVGFFLLRACAILPFLVQGVACFEASPCINLLITIRKHLLNFFATRPLCTIFNDCSMP